MKYLQTASLDSSRSEVYILIIYIHLYKSILNELVLHFFN